MIDWDSIDTVLLDMDGTLLDLHFDNYFWTEHLPDIYSRKHQLDETITIEALQAQLDIETIVHAAAQFGIAHLLMLLQPDRQRQLRVDTHFPGIHHFDEIMPPAGQS